MKNGRIRFNSLTFFVLLLIGCTIVRVAVALFSGAGTVCREESLNLELAQNIRLYGRLTIYGTQNGFSSILYPVLLAPFFGIENPDIRLKAISVLNALLVSSALIPAWLLCRKLLKNEIHRMAALLLFAVSANLWFSDTYMAECLLIPLVLWEVWFLLCAFETGMQGTGKACGLGLWTYLVFMTAPAGVAVAVGALFLFVREAAAETNGKDGLRGVLGFGVSFAVAYLLVMAVCFGGKPYLYPELSGGRINAPERLLFGLYAGLCELLWFVAGSLFFPALVPTVFRKQQDSGKQRLTAFLIAFTVAAACLTVYAVSLREDFVRMDIRVVLRYFIPAGWMFILLYPDIQEKAGKSFFRHPMFWPVAALVVLCALFLRIPRAEGSLDAPVLQVLGTLGGGRLMTVTVRAAAVLLLVSGAALWIRGRKKTVTGLVLAALLVMNILNGALTLAQLRQEKNTVSGELREEAKTLAGYLDTLDGSILFIALDPGGDEQRLADLYCDTDHYLVGMDTLRKMAVDAAEPGVVLPGEAGRENSGLPERTHYLVCRTGELELFSSQYRECTPEGVSFMRVYRSEDPGRIDATDLFALHTGETVRFTRENPEHLGYPVSGFSDPESGFTWTEGREATIRFIPVSEGMRPVDLVWTRKMTSGGEQGCRIYADDELLFDGTVNGGGELRIPIPQAKMEKNEPVTFRFVLPDARQPENGDQRFLAVAFVSLSLAER